ncbi:MAG: 50S ribosomal protein L11 methyltransferase, partial [Deltaproteobacteria bacterium]|nr:50S ribosomal protein L11 methyltransferase [Deltaproteobacteria bacterium]
MYDQLIFTGPPAALERCYPVLCAFDYCGLAEEGPPEGITWRVSLPPTAPRAAWEDCLQRCLAEGRGAIRGRIASAEAIDWANQWRAFFAPIRIGAMEIRADDIVPNPRPPHRIYLQPGMAFGTG